MVRKTVPGPLPEEHVKKLARRLIDGQLSLFVGAGLSHLAPTKDGSDRRLPLWSGLTAQVAEACNQDAEVFSGDPLDLFDAIVFGQERGTLERAIAEAIDDTPYDLASVHRALGDLPWRALVTTNYDGLLQRLLGEEPVVCEDDYDRRSDPEDRQPRLFQVHGTRFRPHTLTRDDYRLWEENHPRAARHIHELLERGTFLFVGYSLADPHLDSILARVRQMTRGREKRLYAWMWRYPEQKIRLLDQRDKIEAVSIEKEEHWAAAFQQLAAAVEQLRRKEGPSPPPAGADPFGYDREQYLRAVRTRYGAANLQGLYVWGAGYARDDVALEEVFVEPDLLRHEPGTQTEPDAAVPKTLRDLRRLRERTQEGPETLSRRLSAFALFHQESRVIIVGAPGQGKSTLLRAWLLKAAERWAASPETHPFPVLIRLAEWERKAEAGEAGLLDLVREGLPSFGEIGSNAAQRWLEGPVLWLLDGVDEIRDRYERERLREEVLAVAASRPGDRWIVSTRPAGEPAGGWGAGWALTELPLLTDGQIEAVLAAWSRVLEAKEGLALDAREMAGSLQKDPGLRTLQGNALLLTLAVLFYKARRRLPHDRWEFFEVAEQVLRDSWVHHRVRHAEEHLPGGYLTELLERLAWAGMEEGIVLFSRERLEQETAGLLTDRGYVGAERDREVARFLRAAEDLIGVFVAQGPDQFGFLHLTFQEFLAARALVHRTAEAPEHIARYWDHPDWEQVWVLYALGVESDPRRLSELHRTILASGHLLDETLERPRLMSLRLAGVGSRPIPQAAQESVNWAAEILLSKAQRWKRAQACRVLTGWERTLPGVVLERALNVLKHEEEADIKPDLIRVLASAAPQPAVLDALLQRLDDQEFQVVDALIRALGSVASEPSLRQALLLRLDDQEDGGRWAAVYALGSVASEPAVHQTLLQCLDDREAEVRSAAARALGSVASEPAVRQTLLQRLDDQKANVRLAAAQALGSVASEPAVRQALLQRLDDQEAKVRSAAAQALGSVASESAVRQALLQRLDDQEANVRSAAAQALGSVASESAVRQALLQRLDDQEANVRSAAVRALGSVATESAVRQALLQRLDDQEANVRSVAVWALGLVASEPAVQQAFLDRLGDQDASVRWVAAQALSSVASEPAVHQVLLERLDDQEAYVRRSTVLVFRSLVSEPAVRQALLQRLDDREADIRWAAAQALGSAAAEPAVLQVLLEHLDDQDAHTRWAAIRKLGSVASEPSVLPSLLRRLDDEVLFVQRAAAEALKAGVERKRFALE